MSNKHGLLFEIFTCIYMMTVYTEKFLFQFLKNFHLFGLRFQLRPNKPVESETPICLVIKGLSVRQRSLADGCTLECPANECLEYVKYPDYPEFT
jgi:hypothetical protein